MRRFTRTGLFVGFCAAALAVVGLCIYGLASNASPAPLERGVRLLVTPFQRAFTALGDWFDERAAYVTDFEALKAENAALKAELAQARESVREAALLIDENARLRELLDMRARHEEYDLAAASVIGTETGGWGYGYILDLGTDDGVAAGQCVIVDEGMVGVISKAGDTWSTLRCVTATEMRAGVIVTRTRETAVMCGSYEYMKMGRMELTYLPAETKARVGDTIETSGSGGELPRGMVIGTIEQLRYAEDGMTCGGVIKPVCDLTQLSRVFIVRSFTLED